MGLAGGMKVFLGKGSESLLEIDMRGEYWDCSCRSIALLVRIGRFFVLNRGTPVLACKRLGTKVRLPSTSVVKYLSI